MTWRRVSRRERCPVCNRPDYCTIAPDGGAVRCMRVTSPHPTRGGGYLHRLGESARFAPASSLPAVEAPALKRAELAAIAKRFASGVSPARLAGFAASLGLSVESLRRLGVGRADGFEWVSSKGRPWTIRAWTFPMVDARGAVTGFRLRTDQGLKVSLTRGREGLFVPVNLPWGESAINPARPLLVCEGPTSLAALLDLGFPAIGRPSCSSGNDVVRKWLSVGPPRHVVVVGDNDEEKRRPDGTVFFPGQDGARVLAAAVAGVARSVRVLIPPVRKDCRDWLKSGATRADVAAAIAALTVLRKAA